MSKVEGVPVPHEETVESLLRKLADKGHDVKFSSTELGKQVVEGGHALQEFEKKSAAEKRDMQLKLELGQQASKELLAIKAH